MPETSTRTEQNLIRVRFGLITLFVFKPQHSFRFQVCKSKQQCYYLPTADFETALGVELFGPFYLFSRVIQPLGLYNQEFGPTLSNTR